MTTERYFNIAGPCIPGEHYMLPALDRLPSVRRLVDRKQYFVLHAPRQTGKTTALKALVREINAKGEKVALYCTLETLQNATDPERRWPQYVTCCFLRRRAFHWRFPKVKGRNQIGKCLQALL